MTSLRKRRWLTTGITVLGLAGLLWLLLELDRRPPQVSTWRPPVPAATVEPQPDPAVADEQAGEKLAEAPLYTQCRVRGAVTAGEDERIHEGAVVRLTTRDELRGVLQTETLTDARGRYTLELPIPRRSGNRRGRAWLALEVDSPGHVLYLRELWVELEGERSTIEHDAWLEPGGSFVGRIVDSDGEALHRAEVYLYGALDGAANGPTWIEIASTRSLPDGRFALRYSGPGDYNLRARADGYGAALLALGLHEVVGREQLGHVSLNGGGTLSGRIVDPDGVGLDGIQVRAVHARLGSDASAWDPEFVSQTRGSQGTDGQLLGEARTRADGAFNIAGLAPGEYWLHVSPGGRDGGASAHPGPYPVGSRDLRLVLAEYRVQVVMHARPSGDQPAARAYCASLRETPLGWRPDEVVDLRSAFEQRNFTFRVEPGRTYAVGVASSSLPVMEEEVTIEEGAYRRRIDLYPDRARSFGRVRLIVRSSDASPLRAAVVEICSPQSGVPLQTRRPPLGSDGCVLELAAGRYLVRVSPRVWPIGSRYLLPAEGEIDVPSGGTETLELECRIGGRVRLTLEPPAAFTDSQLAALRAVVLNTDQRPAGSVRAHRGARVTLTPVGSEHSRELTWVFDDGLRPAPPDRMLPGETLVSAEALEPGSYVLHVELEGCESMQQTVEIGAGRTESVQIPVVEKTE